MLVHLNGVVRFGSLCGNGFEAVKMENCFYLDDPWCPNYRNINSGMKKVDLVDLSWAEELGSEFVLEDDSSGFPRLVWESLIEEN